MTAPAVGCTGLFDEQNCAPIGDGLPEIANGTQIFPGSVPLYRAGRSSAAWASAATPNYALPPVSGQRF